jgi:hypothetical protein
VLIQSPVPASTVKFSIFEVPPAPNEDCIYPYSISIGSTVYANFTFPIVDGLWYTFVGTGERLVGRLGQLCNNTSHSTSISIFTGTCIASVLSQFVASSSSLCDATPFLFETELGTKYFVLMKSDVSDTIVDFSIDVAPVVPNDRCSNAIVIPIGTAVFGNFSYASADYDEVASDCILDGPVLFGFYSPGPPIYKGLWYTFVGNGGRWAAQSQRCDAGVHFMSIYRGGCGINNLRCVKGTDNLCGNEPFLFDTQRGRTYHVLVQSTAVTGLVDVTISATGERCGLLGLGVFCPRTWYVWYGTLFGQLIGRILGLALEDKQ